MEYDKGIIEERIRERAIELLDESEYLFEIALKMAEEEIYGNDGV
tara:strand:+ start:39 stop:173 length:135 start_codon:yes stop_codon:yes gene_type:complete